MAGINDTDIRLSKDWQLTAASTGDAPVCSEWDCFLQDIQLEAISQPGELFYDQEWGWGLLEFIQSEDDSFTRLEIVQRVKDKLSRRSEIDVTTIELEFEFQEAALLLYVKFQFADDSRKQLLNLELSRINMEVKLID
ncbi:MAG: DUF2634 domain-containing protein [Hungatella sp.]|jgi:hypothetical protein|nr:DUF2634 domain-containing protein [Hungatella sp.]